MKILLILLLTASLAHASTNYVYYNNQTKVPQLWTNSCTYNIDKDSIQMGDVCMGGIDWSVIRVASTTDPIPTPFTNINQVTKTVILPLSTDQKNDADKRFSKDLKAALKGFMKAHNDKAPAGEKLDWTDVKAAIKEQLEK